MVIVVRVYVCAHLLYNYIFSVVYMPSSFVLFKAVYPCLTAYYTVSVWHSLYLIMRCSFTMIVSTSYYTCSCSHKSYTVSTSSETGRVQTYVTKNTNLFSRDFTRKDFFYCEKCKSFAFVNCSEDTDNCVDPCPMDSENKTQCNSTLEMMRTVIYPGDIQEQSANSEL